MTRRIVCLLFALLFVFVAVNVTSAEETQNTTEVQTAVADSCGCHASFDPCNQPVVYRRGLLGLFRPVVLYPTYPRVLRPVYPVYPAYHVYPAHAVYPAYCW